MLKNSNPQYYQELAHKLISGTITSEEKQILEEWYKEIGELDIEVPYSTASDEVYHSKKLFEEIRKHLTNYEITSKKLSVKKSQWRMIAAAVIVCVIISNFFWYLKIKNSNHQVVINQKEILPGTNGANLQLANGKNIILTNVEYGSKIDSIYNSPKNKFNNKRLAANDFNTLTTPNGKQWKMILPDGTKVLLNAGSSLKFPVSFSGKNERIVELVGEAYFDVVHNEKQPFKVKVGKEFIEDIGTIFNVSNYSGEKVKATLIKGSIKIGNHILKPGEEAVVDNAKIKIEHINTRNATAWTEDEFSLENITIPELMNQLSRWYNIQVEYKGIPPTGNFGGFLDRNVPLSNILSVLNANGINAKIEDKKIIVLSK